MPHGPVVKDHNLICKSADIGSLSGFHAEFMSPVYSVVLHISK